MVKQKSKFLGLFLFSLAVLGTVYFYHQRDLASYSQSSLLEGHKRTTATEANRLEEEGYHCYKDYRYKASNFKETAFGSSYDLESKETSNFICIPPQEESRVLIGNKNPISLEVPD